MPEKKSPRPALAHHLVPTVDEVEPAHCIILRTLPPTPRKPARIVALWRFGRDGGVTRWHLNDIDGCPNWETLAHDAVALAIATMNDRTRRNPDAYHWRAAHIALAYTGPRDCDVIVTFTPRAVAGAPAPAAV